MTKRTVYLNGVKLAKKEMSLAEDQDYSKYYPLLAGLGAAGLASPLVYRAMRRVTPSRDSAVNAVRAAAKDKFTRVVPTKAPESALGRWWDRMKYTGGDPVEYSDYKPPTTPKNIKGLVRYSEPSDALHVKGDISAGAGPEHSDLLKSIQDNKWNEYQFFNKHAPEAFGKSENIKDILGQLGHTEIPADPTAQAAMLDQLQGELRNRYGKGFLLKDTGGLQSMGIFPGEKSDFNPLLKGYREAGLEQKYNEGVKNLYRDYDGEILNLNAELRDHPHYAGRVLEQVLRSPENVMVQERLPLAQPTNMLRRGVSKMMGIDPNYETRVHVENGRVIPNLTSFRYDPVMEVANRDILEGAGNFAQDIVNKLPPEHRNMSFAMDVHPLEDGTFKLMESNPGGQSGFLYPDIQPLSGPNLRRAHMGNYAKPISALTAGGVGLGAGLAAGGGTYMAQDAFKDSAPKNKQAPLQRPDMSRMPVPNVA